MRRPILVATFVAAALAAVGIAMALRRISRPAGPLDFLPRPLSGESSYVGSSACRQCHPKEHATWHASYHSSMTRPTSADSVLAPFDVTLTRNGWPYHFRREGDEFRIDMVDLDWERGQDDPSANPTPPRVEKRVVMVTGSHHKQVFWVPGSRPGELLRIPWSYRIDLGRWIPTEADYLSHPDFAASGGPRWNDNCIQCHAVGGQPQKTVSGFETRVAELGVACEACHGPGAGHVRARGSGAPLAPGNDPIINPRLLSAHRSAEVCGQCHVASVIRDSDGFDKHGFAYRPGDDLSETMHVLRGGNRPVEPLLREVLLQEPDLLRNRFWSDGTIRVTGREFNGLIESACHQRGELSCLSCHSMHGYKDADDQLARSALGNDACTQCHRMLGENLERHTHHAAGSSGSLCYNCHMPHTTYGLFKAVRAHRIDSPNATTSLRSGRPNACNLCHLDQTMAWTSERLHVWYGHAEIEKSDDLGEISAALSWLLRGDAAQRAIVTWHLGWKPALEASGDDWQAPFLAATLDDPYAAVRCVAGRTLQKQRGFDAFEYDFLAPEKERHAAVLRAIEQWRHSRDPSSRSGATILIAPDGTLDPRVDILKALRDDQPVYINE